MFSDIIKHRRYLDYNYGVSEGRNLELSVEISKSKISSSILQSHRIIEISQQSSASVIPHYRSLSPSGHYGFSKEKWPEIKGDTTVKCW
jgi:hypothetical protein